MISFFWGFTFLLILVCIATFLPFLAKGNVSKRFQLGVGFLLTLFVVLGSYGLYSRWGAYAELVMYYTGNPLAAEKERTELREVLAFYRRSVFTERLKLEENPSDVSAWVRLGQLYRINHESARSLDAFEHAYELKPHDSEIAIQYINAVTEKKSGLLEDHLRVILTQILTENPKHSIARNILALDAFQRGWFEEAKTLWTELIADLAQSPENEEIRKTFQNLILQCGIYQKTPYVDVSVSIAPTEHYRFSKQGVIYVIARATTGEVMPLAVVRKSAETLPFRVRLGVLQAMTKEWDFTKVKEITIEAHVSGDGNVTRQTGDLFGKSKTLVLNDIKEFNLVLE